jgi:hypothetical protein
MSRRATLPGADELFRRTGDAPEAEPPPAEPPVATAPSGTATAVLAEEAAPPSARPAPSRRRSRSGERRPTGRERHDEKITVYVSPEELVDLEQAKLVLRAQHGLGVDRGRIVREALAVVIADL